MVLAVVLLQHRADQQPALVVGEGETGAAQRFAIFHPRSGLHAAHGRLAAEVGRAITGDQGRVQVADLSP